MNQINSFRYEVTTGETVTMVVTPVNVGVFVAASLDGHTFSPLPGGGATPTFVFTVTKPVGRSHFVMMEFSFPGAPNTAQYRVDLTGSNGGAFTFAIKKTSAIKDPIIRFKVV